MPDPAPSDPALPLAALRDAAPVAAACARLIARCRDASGAIAYTPGAAPRDEPTALSLLAAARLSAAGSPAPGLPDPADPALLAWLRARPPGWGLALLPALPLPDDLRAASLRWLLSARSLPVEGMDGFDATLPGWSWVEGTAAWVEPTARALIALSRCPDLPGNAPEIAPAARQQAAGEGIRLLLDRQCSDGGWNYGNPRVLGQELASDAHSTGWAVLGLCAARDAAPGGGIHARIEPGSAAPIPAALDRAAPALDRAAARPGLASLALCALARRASGGDPAPAIAALLPRLDPEEAAGGRADWSALCILALSGLSL